jgi:hypothetical protein
MAILMDVFLAVVVCALALVPAEAAALPDGYGISARYPGDQGIAKDPAVLFAEDFEGASLERVRQHWGGQTNNEQGVLSLSSGVPAGSAGKYSLEITATRGQNQGGSLYVQLPRPVDAAFARFYVKYDSKHFAYHCGIHFGGYNPPTAWPQGDRHPRGDDCMMVEIMPVGAYGKPEPPAWEIAGFWPEMKISVDGNYWGNSLSPARPALVALDRWQCVEVMFRSNSAPDKSDGELALWLDGQLAMHIRPGVFRGPWSGMGFRLAAQGGEPFQGFRWRTSNKLKINFLWLLYNVTNPNPASPVSHVWYDDIVVSTQYVGPISR